MLCIRELYREDIPQIATFLAAQIGSSRESLTARLSWLTHNPASQPDIPLAIGLYHAEKLSGTMILIPNRFSDGSAVRTCILSALFYVDERVRGTGLQLFLKFRSLSAKYPLYAATANAASAPLWRSFGGMPVEFSDREFIRIARWRPVIQEIFRIGSTPNGADIAETSPPGDLLSPLIAVDCAELNQTKTPTSQGAFELIRDPALLSWKVYAQGQKVYRFSGESSDCFCVLQHSRRGYRQQIKAMEIVDLWRTLSEKDWTPFVTAIRRAFAPDVITFRGCSSVARLGFARRGFHQRNLKSPAAWLIDPNRLLEGRFLYSSLAGE